MELLKILVLINMEMYYSHAPEHFFDSLISTVFFFFLIIFNT